MALKVGDKIPNFTAKDTNGNLFDSQQLYWKKASSYLLLSQR
jgi:peroxiredoxin Q/BCP